MRPRLGRTRRPRAVGAGSVDSSTTSTGTGTGAGTGTSAGPRILDLDGERKQHQHNMPIATTPHPDGPAYDEELATAKAIKRRVQPHQRLTMPPLLPQVPHSHPHPHPNPHPHPYQHHPQLAYTHGVATPSGLRNEFKPPVPPRTHSRHHTSSRSADFDAGIHRRAFAVWSQDTSSDDNSP